MTWLDRTSTLVALGVLVACGPSAGGDGSGSGSHSGSDSATDSETSSGTSAGTGTSDSGTSDSGTSGFGTSDSGSSGGGSSGGMTCPGGQAVTASFEFTTTDPIPLNGNDLPCAVLSVTTGPDSTSVKVSCAGDGEPSESTITWASTGHIEPILGMGEAVLLSYMYDDIFWTNRWFALKVAGEQPWLVAAGAEGSALDPPNGLFNDILEQPAVAFHEGVCAADSTDCGDLERLQADLTYDGVTDSIVAPGIANAGQLVSYRLVVEQATHYVGQVECLDVPGYWYDFVIESVPEG